MEQITGHWKKHRNPKYLGSWDLQREDGTYFETVVTIAEMRSDKVHNVKTNKEELTLVCVTKETKPFIINATNAKAISSVAGSDRVEKWVNHRITLYVKIGVKSFGSVVDALAVKPIPPKSTPSPTDKENLNPQHEKWEGAKTALQSGTTTIEAIKKAYNLSAENEDLLKGVSQ